MVSAKVEHMLAEDLSRPLQPQPGPCLGQLTWCREKTSVTCWPAVAFPTHSDQPTY